MESIPFLTVDGDSISLNQALKYLRTSGKLQQLLAEVLRPYVLEKELEAREDIQGDPFRVEQAIIDLRLQSQLTDQARFTQWLKNNGLTYADLHNQIAFALKVEALKNEVTEPKLEGYFAEQKSTLDRVVLSRIIVNEKELAELLNKEILAQPSRFEALAKQHSIAEDRVVSGIMGPIPLAQLPEGLKTAVNTAKAGDLIGPLEIDGRFCLFRVEHFMPATLEGQLKRDLQNQLFDRWLQEKLQKMSIKLEVQ